MNFHTCFSFTLKHNLPSLCKTVFDKVGLLVILLRTVNIYDIPQLYVEQFGFPELESSLAEVDFLRYSSFFRDPKVPRDFNIHEED